MNDDVYAAIDAQKIPAQESAGADGAAGGQDFDREAYIARKQAERDAVFSSLDEITERISSDPVAFRDYLDVMARFPYSATNALLIFDQAPDATRLADFESWKRSGAQVKKGQHAISILEPGDEYTRPDGSIGTSYNIKHVFDEKQTTARHLEPRYPDTRTLLFTLIDQAPVDIKTVDSLQGDNEYAHYDHNTKTIWATRDLSEQQLFKALTVELAQAALAARGGDYDHEANRETALFAAYVVAGRYGADNSGLMPVLTPQAPQDDAKEVRKELSLIRDTAKTITDRVDKNLEAKQFLEAAPAPKHDKGERNDAR